MRISVFFLWLTLSTAVSAYTVGHVKVPQLTSGAWMELRQAQSAQLHLVRSEISLQIENGEVHHTDIRRSTGSNAVDQELSLWILRNWKMNRDFSGSYVMPLEVDPVHLRVRLLNQ